MISPLTIMTNKITPLKTIETIISDTISILQRIENLPQMSDSHVADYKVVCQGIPEQIRAGRLKIAIVGVIKSGKSTFVNSLVQKELVKRGAGVITSITTRIRKGKKNQANIYFKSWDDINSRLQKALQVYPCSRSDNDSIDGFDLRRKNDREFLKKVYQSLISDLPAANDGIRPETLLIMNALQGFDACKDLVQADETTLRFESKDFDRHKSYTSDPSKAFYIKDVCLDVYGRVLDPNIEIADCQGADSTDPAQLAHVLTYLESSNLIVYCISSRTGLRQSDVTFLKQIKNLGLLDNILFVNNCDLTEHETLADLIKIEDSIRDHLEFLEIQPKLFSFSSLYNLFLKIEPKLAKRDLSRLKLWQDEKKMVQYCDLGTNEFNSLFQRMIDKNRHELLISNHLKRLGIINAQLDLRADIFLDLLSSDKSKEETAVRTLDNLQHNASRLESIVANSINGAVSGLNDEIDFNIKKAFDQDEEAILENAQNFIRKTTIDYEQYRHTARESGFNQILYLMFQDFKRKLDLYVIEAVKPVLKKIVSAQEERIISYFQSLFDSYQIDLVKADQYAQFETVSKLRYQQGDFIDSVDINKIKKILGLQLPSVIFEAKYTPRIKANVFTDFGLQTISQILSTILNRKSDFSFSPALKKAAIKIKKENQKVIKDQFEQYQAIVKINYFLPLIDAVTRDFKEKINNRFSRYHSFQEEIEHLFSLQQSEKNDQRKIVLSIKKQIQSVMGAIEECSETSWK